MREVEIDGKIFAGYKIPTTNVSMLLINSPKGGILACGYISREAADKFGDVVAIVTGVNSFEDMLAKEIVFTSKAAQKLGITIGMKGKDALLKMW